MSRRDDLMYKPLEYKVPVNRICHFFFFWFVCCLLFVVFVCCLFVFSLDSQP